MKKIYLFFVLAGSCNFLFANNIEILEKAYLNQFPNEKKVSDIEPLGSWDVRPQFDTEVTEYEMRAAYMHFFQKHFEPHVSGVKTISDFWEESGFFETGQSGHVLNLWFPAQTRAGEVYGALYAKHMLANGPDAIRKRQNRIKELVKNREALLEIQDALSGFRVAESTVLDFYDKSNPVNQSLVQSKFSADEVMPFFLTSEMRKNQNMQPAGNQIGILIENYYLSAMLLAGKSQMVSGAQKSSAAILEYAGPQVLELEGVPKGFLWRMFDASKIKLTAFAKGTGGFLWSPFGKIGSVAGSVWALVSSPIATVGNYWAESTFRSMGSDVFHPLANLVLTLGPFSSIEECNLINQELSKKLTQLNWAISSLLRIEKKSQILPENLRVRFSPSLKRNLREIKYFALQLEPGTDWTHGNLGTALAVLRRIMSVRKELSEVFIQIGKLDFYVAVASKMSKDPNQDNGLVFAEILDENDLRLPKFFAENLHNPMIDQATSVGSDVCLGADCPQGILLTGDNGAGKSTQMRAVMLNILFSQLLGIAVADYLELTPFDYINSFLENSDEADVSSSYFAELFNSRDMKKEQRAMPPKSMSISFHDELYSSTKHDDAVTVSEMMLDKLCGFENNLVMVSTHANELTGLVGGFKCPIANMHMTPGHVLTDGPNPFVEE